MSPMRFRSRSIHGLHAAVTGCIMLLASGCFLNRMPSAEELEAPPPSRPSVVEDDRDNATEPAIEEPIRPIDDEADDVEAAIPLDQFGDMNDDGILDDTDVELFRLAFGNFGDDEFVAAADFDGDGSVTLVDFQMFLNMTTGEDIR